MAQHLRDPGVRRVPRSASTRWASRSRTTTRWGPGARATATATWTPTASSPTAGRSRRRRSCARSCAPTPRFLRALRHAAPHVRARPRADGRRRAAPRRDRRARCARGRLALLPASSRPWSRASRSAFREEPSRRRSPHDAARPRPVTRSPRRRRRPRAPVLERSSRPRAAAAAPSSARPLRIVFVYVPNGVNRPAWRPEGRGRRLSPMLPPLVAARPVPRRRLLVLSGLGHRRRTRTATAPATTRAPRPRSSRAPRRKTSRRRVRVGISIDQVVAQRIGGETQRPVPRAVVRPGRRRGRVCDSGYSCAYCGNISWKSPTLPMAKETDPRRLFDRLFTDRRGAGTPEEKARRRRKRTGERARPRARRGAGARAAASAPTTAAAWTSTSRASARSSAGSRAAKRHSAEAAPGRGRASPPQGPAAGPRRALRAARRPARARLPRRPHAHRDVDDRQRGEQPLATPTIGVPEGHHGISHHGDDPASSAKIQRRWTATTSSGSGTSSPGSSASPRATGRCSTRRWSCTARASATATVTTTRTSRSSSPARRRPASPAASTSASRPGRRSPTSSPRSRLDATGDPTPALGDATGTLPA